MGPYLESFDLTLRKVTAQFNSGLPTTSAITLEVSQDGSTATMSNGQGNAVILDTLHGVVQQNIQGQNPPCIFQRSKVTEGLARQAASGIAGGAGGQSQVGVSDPPDVALSDVRS